MEDGGAFADGFEKVRFVQARHALAQQVLIQQVAFIEEEIAANGGFGEMAIAGELDAADMKRGAPIDGRGQVGFGRLLRARFGGLHLQVDGKVQNAFVLGLAARHEQRGAEILVAHQAVERMDHLGHYSIAGDLPGRNVIKLRRIAPEC